MGAAHTRAACVYFFAGPAICGMDSGAFGHTGSAPYCSPFDTEVNAYLIPAGGPVNQNNVIACLTASPVHRSHSGDGALDGRPASNSSSKLNAGCSRSSESLRTKLTNAALWPHPAKN